MYMLLRTHINSNCKSGINVNWNHNVFAVTVYFMVHKPIESLYLITNVDLK